MTSRNTIGVDAPSSPFHPRGGGGGGGGGYPEATDKTSSEHIQETRQREKLPGAPSEWSNI